jgi:hypothetical protein
MILLADEVGTPDGCRFWDRNAYIRGELQSLDKDVFRKNNGDLSATYIAIHNRITKELEYIDINYIPNDGDFVCEYRIEPAIGVGFQDACTNLAGESSIDTWSDILTLSPEIASMLKPHVFEMDEK